MEKQKAEQAAMKEAVALLKKQLLLGNSCVEWLRGLKDAGRGGETTSYKEE